MKFERPLLKFPPHDPGRGLDFSDPNNSPSRDGLHLESTPIFAARTSLSLPNIERNRDILFRHHENTSDPRDSSFLSWDP